MISFLAVKKSSEEKIFEKNNIYRNNNIKIIEYY